MTQPIVFDEALRRRRRARAERRGPSFLLERMVFDACDRICLVQKRFQSALLIGPDKFTQELIANLPDDKCPERIATLTHIDLGVQMHSAPKPLAKPYDIVVFALDLETTNDVMACLGWIKSVMTADGLYMSCFFAGETLRYLRHAFYAAEADVGRPASPRIHPFITHEQAAQILVRAGFAMPVIDIDRVNVRYGALRTLLEDIRDVGAGNCLVERDKRRLPKNIFAALETAYAEIVAQNNMSQESKTEETKNHKLDKYPAQFEIFWMTGWVPSQNQPKPLKPGSAKISLADGLRSIRDGSRDTDP